jgi:hypothetical protein
MPQMRTVLLQLRDQLYFVEIPESYAYQLTALHLRLHKEMSKLTASNVPDLPYAVAEFNEFELTGQEHTIIGGLDYMNELEQKFTTIDEKAYPLISLLTEIRALQAQLEQWYEEEYEG